jgi:tetratricopeptide (TPR) repeat protein
MLYDNVKGDPVISIYTDKVIINHSGYGKNIIKNKINRNKSLLEQNYAEGKSEVLDYFYLARENLQADPKYAKQFMDMLYSSDYQKVLDNINIGNSLYELEIKLSNSLSKEYSFEERETIIKRAEEKDVGNPIYQYYKYSLYKDYDNKKAKEALEKSIELDKEYENKNKGQTSSFYKKKSDVFLQLGNQALTLNDNIKAMDYYVKSIATKVKEPGALKGLMYIISNESSEDIIIFLNSLFNMNSEEDLRFIVENLRLTLYHPIFLYYFVKWNKKFDKIDFSFFTSRLLTGNFEEIARVYMEIFLAGNDEKAIIAVIAAIIAGNCDKLYEEYKFSIPGKFGKILSAFFKEEELSDITNTDIEIFTLIFREIAYIANEQIIDRLKSIFKNKIDKVYNIVAEYYFFNNSYNLAARECEKLIQSESDENYLNLFYSILGFSYFKLNKFEEAKKYLEKAIDAGDLKKYVAEVYEYIIENTESTLEEKNKIKNYNEILNKWNKSKKLILNEKIKDELLTVMTRDKFEDEIENRKGNILELYLEDFYNFAVKNLELENFNLAASYFIDAIKYNYKEKALCYYRLGEVYNKLKNIDMSQYCYEKAFILDLKLAAALLPEDHKNHFYLFGKENEEINEVCPICKEHGRDLYCFTNIEDEHLTYADSPISVYKYCDNCNHIFVRNYRNKKRDSIPDEILCDDKIFNAYDILEKININKPEHKILVIDDSCEIAEIFSRNGYNVEHIKTAIEKEKNLSEFMNQIKEKTDANGMLLINLFDIDSIFNTNKKYLWSNAGNINVFSKKSIESLLKRYGFSIIKMYNSKYVKGKMVIIANI